MATRTEIHKSHQMAQPTHLHTHINIPYKLNQKQDTHGGRAIRLLARQSMQKRILNITGNGASVIASLPVQQS